MLAPEVLSPLLQQQHVGIDGTLQGLAITQVTHLGLGQLHRGARGSEKRRTARHITLHHITSHHITYITSHVERRIMWHTGASPVNEHENPQPNHNPGGSWRSWYTCAACFSPRTSIILRRGLMAEMSDCRRRDDGTSNHGVRSTGGNRRHSTHMHHQPCKHNTRRNRMRQSVPQSVNRGVPAWHRFEYHRACTGETRNGARPAR